MLIDVGATETTESPSCRTPWFNHYICAQTAQCIVIGPVCLCVCVCGCVCLFVGLLPRQLEIACIDPHQTGSVGEGIVTISI